MSSPILILNLNAYLCFLDLNVARFDLKRSNLKKKYMHLTNFSVNKKASEFVRNQNAEQSDEGSKWLV
jgi:hypothetical protein